MADPGAAGASASQTPTTPLTARQEILTAALRCHYAEGTTNTKRPDCQGVAVVAYGPIALCRSCDTMRSAVGRTHPARRLPGAELSALIHAARMLAQAEAEVAVVVGLARAAGASWSHVGDAVGVSRQAAQQRWGHAVERHSTLSTNLDTLTDPVSEEVTATSEHAK